MIARVRREAMLKFEYFKTMLNKKAVFCDAFLGKNLKRLFSNTFFSFILHSKMIVRTAEID